MDEDEETPAQISRKVKAFLEMVKAHPETYSTRTIYNGEVIYALDKTTGMLWIINTFKEQYEIDFICYNGVKVIVELASQTAKD